MPSDVSGFVARARVGEANRLILKRLSARPFSRRNNGMMNLKDLLTRFPVSAKANLFGFGRAAETWRGRSVDSTRVIVQVAEENGEGFAQSKGLANPVSAELWGDLFGPCRVAETWRGLSVDSAVVVGQVAEPNRRRLAQSQGLANRFSAEA